MSIWGRATIIILNQESMIPPVDQLLEPAHHDLIKERCQSTETTTQPEQLKPTTTTTTTPTTPTTEEPKTTRDESKIVSEETKVTSKEPKTSSEEPNPTSESPKPTSKDIKLSNADSEPTITKSPVPTGNAPPRPRPALLQSLPRSLS
ncbi:hypothetical protein FANTH_14190 [Fusarium anthophilum]|uniref:Uncharacterized protein n=1 Tax=Fusarium anthophilum TaxID=48485 RepID=A0A8H5DN97_9HYPO|nr:hypothetical protein FANTH_14190 [Fusarium anthophilum]